MKHDPDKVKQVIVMRKDLGMRKGKACAQAAHASMKVLLDRRGEALTDSTSENKNKSIYYKIGNFSDAEIEWIEGEFTKIVVGCEGKEPIRRLEKVANELGIPNAVIEDNGHTEFGGVKTVTCIALGPARSALLDDLTGGFKLL